MWSLVSAWTVQDTAAHNVDALLHVSTLYTTTHIAPLLLVFLLFDRMSGFFSVLFMSVLLAAASFGIGILPLSFAFSSKHLLLF